MNNRDFFNGMAEKWDNTVNHDENKIRQILNMVLIKEGDRVLDVGTGTGIMIPFLRSHIGDAGRIIAVDIAEKMIEVARRKYSFENVEFIINDVLEMELPKNYFDCIMCYSMFPHFNDKEAAINSLAECLKIGGRLAICHSQSREAINNLHKGMTDAVQNDRLPSASVLKKYCNDAGLSMAIEVDNNEMFVVIGEKRLSI